MYLEKLIISINEITDYVDICYAHKINDNKEKQEMNETLKEHTIRCQKYFIMLAENKKLFKIMKRFENEYFSDFGEVAIKIFECMTINISTFHDTGKVNPVFQIEKMENKISYLNIDIDNDINKDINSRHAIISSMFYLDYFIEKIALEVDKGNIVENEACQLRDFAYIYSYIISRHHCDMTDFNKYMCSFGKNDKARNKIGIHAYQWYKLWKEKYISYYNNINRKSDMLADNNFKIKSVFKLLRSYKTEEDCYMYKRMSKEENTKSIYLYAWTRLLYSLLVASDYYATSEFMNGVKITEFGEIDNIDDIDKVYMETEVQKSIKDYKENIYPMPSEKLKETKNINDLRTEMYLDAENELLKNSDMNIFYLEAPTGSGKSNTSINLSFKLVRHCEDINKIFYIYPYNTLVEQNINCLENTFGNNENIISQIAVVNSITPYKNNKQNNSDKNEEKLIDTDYQRILLDRQFLNYPIVLSTHVTLFNSLFGNKKEDVFGFHQLCDSVIVMDEIQSYKNSLWGEIITFLNAYSQLFNIKIIIMSATLPNLDILISNSDKSVKLIKDREKYFNNSVFKNRVIPDYSLLKVGWDKISLEELKSHVLENQHKRVLVEFIKKKSAKEFYQSIVNDVDNGVIVKLMTGDSNIQERKNIIAELKGQESVILVATQVIEAGVDIDMDIGYKDISRLDSEEQFMGRINRSCKKKGCIVYFFNYDDARKIYKNDARLNNGKTLEDDDIKEILENKNFSKFYEAVFEDLIRGYKSRGNYNMSDFFKDNIGHLDMEKVSKHMRLIDDNSLKAYLYLNIEKTEIDYNAKELWEEYKSLLSNPELINNRYPEKKVRLQEIRSKMNVFMYQIQSNLNWINAGGYDEQIGNIYYIENGKDYIDGNGMLNEEMVGNNEELFL